MVQSFLRLCDQSIDDASNIWTFFKLMVITMFSWFLSVMTPVGNILFLILVFFSMNIFGGILTYKLKGETFSMKKFSEAFLQFLLFSMSIIALQNVGITFKDAILTESGVKWLAYVIIWGYSVNILKNAKIKWPQNRSILLLYDILTIEAFNILRKQFNLKKSKNVQDEDSSTE